jgi:hypothetical protein
VAVAQVTVVVDGAPSGAWGSTPLADASVVADTWLVPGTTGAAPTGISVANFGAEPVVVHASVLTATGSEAVPSLDGTTVPAGTVVEVSAVGLAAIGTQPVRVSTSGAVSIAEDLPGGAAPSVASLGALPAGAA